MPRLVGKQSNEGLLVSLLVLAAIAVVTGLEYTGIINVIPGFGKDGHTLSSDSQSISLERTVVYKPVQK